MDRSRIRIHSSCALVVALGLLVLWTQPTSATTVSLESAIMGPTGIPGGQSVSATQFIGWRFQLDSALLLTQVGAHLLGMNGELFAAVVRLDDIEAFPTGAPFSAVETVASVTFTAPLPSNEILVPVEGTLAPGSYALVFGTGMFGATGTGAIPNTPSQTNIPPTESSSYIFWNQPLPNTDPQWRSGLASQMRFLVQGVDLVGTADFNLDGRIDGADLDVWYQNFGMTSGATITLGDAVSDGAVDGADFLSWQQQYGAGVQLGASGTSVPEPASMVLVVLVLSAAILGRARGPVTHPVASGRCGFSGNRGWESAPGSENCLPGGTEAFILK